MFFKLNIFMFKKLKNTFKFSDYESIANQIRYGRVRNDGFYGISYDIITVESNEKLFEVIPERYRNSFALLSMEINCYIRPHTDSGILTTINFYVDSQNAITRFYNVKSSSPDISKFENQTNGEIFNPSDLEEIDSFSANNSEAFILDVTKPHSVTCTQYGTRRALVLQTRNFKYDEVCKMLEETNNL